MSNKKDTSVIPEGMYCYTHENGKQKNCPYWSRNKKYDKYCNGYCSYLEMGDWNYGTLLWDQCKECGIKMDHEVDIIASDASNLIKELSKGIEKLQYMRDDYEKNCDYQNANIIETELNIIYEKIDEMLGDYNEEN